MHVRWYLKRVYIYFHADTMNHLAEKPSLISHLRFLFAPPFAPLSLVHSIPQRLLLGADRTAGEQRDEGVVDHHGKTAAQLRSLWAVKWTQKQQCFGLASAARAALLMQRVALLSGSVTGIGCLKEDKTK